MKDSIVSKLESLQERHQEIAGLLADPDVIADQNQFRKYSMEYSQLEPVVETFSKYRQTMDDLAAASEMLTDEDSGVQEMAQQEISVLQQQQQSLELNYKSCCYRKTRWTTVTYSSKYAPVLAATKRPFLQVTYSACTPAMPNNITGR